MIAGLHKLQFLVQEILCTQNRFRCTSVHVGNRARKTADTHVTNNDLVILKRPLFQSCVLLHPCRLYYFSFHDYTPFLYTIYIAAISFCKIKMRSGGPRTTNFLKIPVQLLFTQCRIPSSM